jgi:hypothetical protein
MTDLQKCYGDTWTVDKVKGGLEYKNAPSMSMDKIPKVFCMILYEIFMI